MVDLLGMLTIRLATFKLKRLRGGGMNIIEAVKEARGGKKIRRKTWHHTHYIYCNNNDILFDRFERKFDPDSKKSYAQILDEEVQHKKYQNEEDKILEKTTYVNDWQVTLRVDDYLANDWEVVKE